MTTSLPRAFDRESGMRHGMRWVSLVLAFLALLVGEASAESAAGRFASVVGPVQVKRGDREVQRATVGMPVLAKDEIQVGDDGRARLLLSDESMVDLASRSSFVSQSDLTGTAEAGRTTVKLNEGTMRAQVSRPTQKSVFEIETPTALVRTDDADLIVHYRAEEGSSEVYCVRGRAQVQGVLGVIGKGVDLAAGRATRVQKGGFPSAARDFDATSLTSYERDLEIVGTGSDDHLDIGHPLVTGHLAAPGDRPRLPAAARASTFQPYLVMAPPGETLVEVLSPDLRTNTQPIPEYLLAAPGEQPPPLD